MPSIDLPTSPILFRLEALAKPSLPLTTLVLALSVVPQLVRAQAAVAPERTLPTTTVTAPPDLPERRGGILATGVDAPAHETPFSGTTVPAALVREQGGTTLQDALRNVPGAQADTGFNGSHTQFFILRGAVTDSGTGSNRVFRDGVRLSNYPYVPAFVDRVEALRGPGAAIGVRSEPGGTVDIVTVQPQLADFGSVSIGAGSRGALETSVDLNRVLSQQRELAARITATKSDASEWRHVPDRLEGLKFGIAQSDGDRYHLRAGVEATHQTYQPDYGLPALGGRPIVVPRDRQFGEPFGNSTTDNRIVDLHGDVALTPQTRLAVDLTHLESHSTSIKNLLNGSPLPRQLVGTYARVSAWEPDTQRRIDSFATSLVSTQVFGDLTHKLYFGLNHYKETLDQPSLSVPASTSPSINVFFPVYGRVTAPPPGANLARSLTTENLESTSASLQDQIDFGAWSVVAGVRFTKQKFLYGTVGVMPVNESRWTPKLAVLRRVSETDTLYANLSTGTSPNQVSSASNQSLASRRSEQAELGWKSLWHGGRLESDVAIYRLKQENMIAADQSTPLNNFDFTLAGTARSQGLEASLKGQIDDRWTVWATYAYTDAKYVENVGYGGLRVPNVARQTASFWAQYAWDARWKTGAGVYAQSRRFADEANTTVLPGYVRVDLTQSWIRKLGGGQSIEVQVALRNLFDKAYFVSSHLHVSRWITPGQGRNVSVSATYRF